MWGRGYVRGVCEGGRREMERVGVDIARGGEGSSTVDHTGPPNAGPGPSRSRDHTARQADHGSRGLTKTFVFEIFVIFEIFTEREEVRFTSLRSRGPCAFLPHQRDLPRDLEIPFVDIKKDIKVTKDLNKIT